MDAVNASLDALARGAASEQDNVYEKVVDAAIAGATHGEMVATLREEMGFGEPLVQV
jgi:methylmalonyl-CoA mutase N-terminal domain/subunit